MELNTTPRDQSSALDGWLYNAETKELYLRWHGCNDIYIYTGNVANFEADVREYRSWGKVANWYAHYREDVILKEVIYPGETHTTRYCYKTQKYSTVYA